MKTAGFKLSIALVCMLFATQLAAQELVYQENIIHVYYDDQLSRRLYFDVTGDGVYELNIDMIFDDRDSKRYNVSIWIENFGTRLDRMKGCIDYGTVLSDLEYEWWIPGYTNPTYHQVAGMGYGYEHGEDKKESQYVAFRREIDGDYYYGWYYMTGIWVDRTIDFSISQAVFCNIPNYPLKAGQTSLFDDSGDNAEPLVSIHPNPTSGTVSIKADNLTKVEVLNVMGQTVLKSDCSGSNVTIDLTEQPAGIYFLNLTVDKGKMSVKKVMKE
jgi:hypothetical protein